MSNHCLLPFDRIASEDIVSYGVRASQQPVIDSVRKIKAYCAVLETIPYT